MEALRAHPTVQVQIPQLEQRVAQGTLPAAAAARRLLGHFLISGPGQESSCG